MEVLRKFRKRFRRKMPELFKSGQWHLHQDNAPTHKSIMTNYLTEIGIKTVPHPVYSPDLAPCDLCMFPRLKEKLRGCRFDDVEEMKETVTEALDTFTLEDYQRAFKKWLERCNKRIELGGPTSRVTEVSCFSDINKCPYGKKSQNFWKGPRMCQLLMQLSCKDEIRLLQKGQKLLPDPTP